LSAKAGLSSRGAVTGSSPISVVRLPGASSASAIHSRPCTGSSDICSGSMLPPTLDCVVSMSGASAVTVTVSWMADGAICTLSVTV